MCIVIICCPAGEVINFEITLNFEIDLSNRFPTGSKKSGQKFKYFKNKKRFYRN